MDKTLEKIKIGYLVNDNSFDNQIIEYFKNLGIHVVALSLEDIGLCLSSQGIEFSVNNEKVHLDGFFSYGYMKPENHEPYRYLLSTLENMNIPKVHSVEAESNFTNKFLQTICFGKKNLSFPKTTLGFSEKSINTSINKNFQNNGLIKKIKGSDLDDHLEFNCTNNLYENTINLLKNGEYSLIQSLIKNDQNKEFRVLILNGKCSVITEYVKDSCQEMNGKSNNSKKKLVLVNDFPYVGPLKSVSETAAKSVGCTLISAVDITISWEIGFVVKDVNGWPDLEGFSEASGNNYIQIFSGIFSDYVISIKKEKAEKWNNYRNNLSNLMNRLPEKCDKCGSQYGVRIGLNNGVASFMNCDENCYKAEFINFPKEETGLSRDLMCGMKWQCVEYSRRWLIYNKEVSFSSIRMAYNIFDIPYAEDLKTEEPVEFRGYPNGNTECPTFGDLLIFPKSTGAPHGHVAVITGVNSDLGYIEICEQNHEVQIWEDPNSYSRRLILIKDGNEYFIMDMHYNTNEQFDKNEIPSKRHTIIGWKRAII